MQAAVEVAGTEVGGSSWQKVMCSSKLAPEVRLKLFTNRRYADLQVRHGAQVRVTIRS